MNSLNLNRTTSNKASSFFYLILFFLSLSTVGISSLAYQYPFVLMLFFIFLFCYPIVKINYIFLWSFLIFILWAYGFFVGLLMQNKTEAIIRNFSGMLLYLPFALIISTSNIRLDKLISYFRVACYLYAPIVFYFIVKDYKGVGDFYTDGSSAFRLYYSIGIFIYYPLVGVFVFGFFFKNYRHICQGNFVCFLLGILFIIASSSKGFFLSLVSLVFLIYISSFFQLIIRRNAIRIHMLILFFFFPVLLYFIPQLLEIAIVLIDIETDPSHPRVLQSKELVQSFTVVGIGLGGALASGFTRDLLGYSMELSYFSILSKFGLIFGTLVIIAVVTPLVIATYRIIVTPRPKYAFALGSSVFLITAWGNPIIFAPLLVFMSCIAFNLVVGKYEE